MTGTVDSGTLTLDLEYRPVAVQTIVDCIIIGGRTDVATPTNIRVRVPANQSSTAYDWAHILQAQFAVHGKTEIRVQLIRIPS